MGRLDILTTVQTLYNARSFNDTTAFYLHNGQYINNIVKNESIGYTIYYSNGNHTLANGDDKVQVQKT